MRNAQHQWIRFLVIVQIFPIQSRLFGTYFLLFQIEPRKPRLAGAEQITVATLAMSRLARRGPGHSPTQRLHQIQIARVVTRIEVVENLFRVFVSDDRHAIGIS